MSVDVNALAVRVTTLERENRRLKRIVLTIVLGLAPMAVMAQVLPPRPRAIESREFTLVDQDNRLRASLQVVVGQPVLIFYDTRGKTRVRLGLDMKGAPTLTAILPSGRDIELLSEWPKLRPLTDPDDLLSSRPR